MLYASRTNLSLLPLSNMLSSDGFLHILLFQVLWESTKSTLSKQQVNLFQTLAGGLLEEEEDRRDCDLSLV